MEMERTGGEPDVAGYNCAAWEERKAAKPVYSALEMAAAMGIDILLEVKYRELQKIGDFDLKTSNWVKTPEGIRKPGGALFCDRRYDHIFVCHNGARSYYAARVFRDLLRV